MDSIQSFQQLSAKSDYLFHLEQIRWKGNPVCPYCNSRNHTTLKGKRRYHCNTCYTQYSVTVRTIFHKTHVDLQKWFLAIFLLINQRSLLSVRCLAVKVGVSKNTAHFMIARIDSGLKDPEQRRIIQAIADYDQTTS